MLPELFAEFFGTLVLVLLGDGVVATTILFGGGAPGEPIHGGNTNIAIGWGLAVAMGICIAGRVSGAHLNPAVSIALAIYRDFSWRKVAPYIAAQTAGAFFAAALVYWNYLPAFQTFDPALEHTASVFITSPELPGAPFAGLLDQTIGTALLLIVILAITDARNRPYGGLAIHANALMTGLAVVVIGMAFGGTTGYPINPARDFGPRLFTVAAGFRNNGLTDGARIFWIPVMGPILGAILGTAAWEYGLRAFSPDTSS